MNRLLRSYHLGDTDDLDFVVRYALSTARYKRVFLTGFSAGGNVTLKYLGENPARVPRQVQQAALLPGQIDLTDLEELHGFPEFDDRFTAPMHGFASAEEYYAHASSGRYLSGIRVPTLLVNAQNDPFLPPSCSLRWGHQHPRLPRNAHQRRPRRLRRGCPRWCVLFEAPRRGVSDERGAGVGWVVFYSIASHGLLGFCKSAEKAGIQGYIGYEKGPLSCDCLNHPLSFFICLDYLTTTHPHITTHRCLITI